jgi:hypothetical protein
MGNTLLPKTWVSKIASQKNKIDCFAIQLVGYSYAKACENAVSFILKQRRTLKTVPEVCFPTA